MELLQLDEDRILRAELSLQERCSTGIATGRREQEGLRF
jgi:hypothetical protein